MHVIRAQFACRPQIYEVYGNTAISSGLDELNMCDFFRLGRTEYFCNTCSLTCEMCGNTCVHQCDVPHLHLCPMRERQSERKRQRVWERGRDVYPSHVHAYIYMHVRPGTAGFSIFANQHEQRRIFANKHGEYSNGRLHMRADHGTTFSFTRNVCCNMYINFPSHMFTFSSLFVSCRQHHVHLGQNPHPSAQRGQDWRQNIDRSNATRQQTTEIKCK